MANVQEVARWFIAYNRFLRDQMDQDTDMISNLKLQKLLFYAQSASLAMRGAPLFEEDILAWKHGPVVYDVYCKYRQYGAIGIDEDVVLDEIEVTEEEEAVLKAVYNLFGEYSAWGLRNLTHEEEPWKSTEQNEVIPKNLMGSAFRSKYLIT